ncbi:heme A synthase [Pseudonocardiaceae bacterium YIM PH 21723]|nr:heme A synthase [Pseudonocardiaceae bacterium YIM PH 21723]
MARIPRPHRALTRAIAIATVVAQGGIAVTGSIVRVTGSGLGCPTWPQCFSDSFTPAPHPEFNLINTWIEFTNRMLTGAVGLLAGLCLLIALRYHQDRPDRRLVWLAASMPIGVVLQAVIGGFTVLLGLVWWSVSVHFLVSMVLVWLAVLMTDAFDPAPLRRLPRPVRGLLGVTTLALTALLIAGTFVTAAGPHAGDAKTPRLHANIATVAQVHADLLFAFLGLLVALGFTLRLANAQRRVARRYGWLIAAVLVQGALGIVQYNLGVPEVLVSLHVLGAGLCVAATAAVWSAARGSVAPAVPETGELVAEPAVELVDVP